MTQSEGTVYKLKNPENPNRTWRARVTLYFPDGSKKVITRHGKTKTAAKSALDHAVSQTNYAYRMQGQQTTDEVFNSLLEDKTLSPNIKAKTIYNNKKDYKKHIEPYIGSISLSTVSYNDLREIQKRLQVEGKLRTAELVRILLNEIYKHALKTNRQRILSGDYKLVNFAEDLPVIAKPAPTQKTYIWTEDERQRFLLASKQRYEKTIISLSYPVFYTMLSAGLRLGEALGIRKENLVGNTLQIRQQFVYYDNRHHLETPKTRASIRDIPISDDHKKVLEIHLDRIEQLKNYDFTDQGLLLPSFSGGPFEPQNLRRTVREVSEIANVPYIGLHTMRKIYATLLTKELVKQGIWSPKLVMELMGHSAPNVAQQIYAQVIEDDKKKAVVRI